MKLNPLISTSNNYKNTFLVTAGAHTAHVYTMEMHYGYFSVFIKMY